MQKRIYLKNPLRLILFTLSVIGLSIFFTLLFQTPASGDSFPEYTTIVVAQGDNLWNIARAYRFENQDIRDKIDEIKELNNITSDIRAGQELTIRVK